MALNSQAESNAQPDLKLVLSIIGLHFFRSERFKAGSRLFRYRPTKIFQTLAIHSSSQNQAIPLGLGPLLTCTGVAGILAYGHT